MTPLEKELAGRVAELERWRTEMAARVVTDQIVAGSAQFVAPDGTTRIYMRAADNFGMISVSADSTDEAPSVMLHASLEGVDDKGGDAPEAFVETFRDGHSAAWLGYSDADSRKAQPQPTTPTTHGIGAADGCGFDGDPGHDWVLGLEERGVAGVAELIARLGLTLDGEAGDDEEVPLWDLTDLCSRHNWKDPAAVERVVTFIIDAMRTRRGLTV